MTTSTWTGELSAALGEQNVLTDPDDRAIEDALDPQGLFHPGKVLRRAYVGDLAATDVLAGRA